MSTLSSVPVHWVCSHCQANNQNDQSSCAQCHVSRYIIKYIQSSSCHILKTTLPQWSVSEGDPIQHSRRSSSSTPSPPSWVSSTPSVHPAHPFCFLSPFCPWIHLCKSVLFSSTISNTTTINWWMVWIVFMLLLIGCNDPSCRNPCCRTFILKHAEQYRSLLSQYPHLPAKFSTMSLPPTETEAKNLSLHLAAMANKDHYFFVCIKYIYGY